MIKPLGDRVVIEVAEAETKTASGIILADTAKEKPMKGVIVAAGPGSYDKDGNRIAMEVKVGDNVLYSKYAGTEVKVDGKDYLIVRQSDILGIVE
ncbi:MAG: co-chaperone GroES [Anaerovibrio sp.]|uniref:co-chaperone GroES n=1 Tax=Anaerovibrio sp. TaxID=1872532 RepID=UPI0025E99E59|nr:co-chaperone GroES [Anaerovibrio sp.]MCR5176696.1 co-chaperone GroES [Anaerovibrio sp.]